MIHDDIMLSAGHCENVNSPFNLRVFINGLETEKGIYRTIQEVHAHPLYNKDVNNDYDFLIIKLHESALKDADGKDTGVQIVALNRDPSLPKVGQNLMASGYGTTYEGAPSTSDILMDVELQYVADEVCASQYKQDTYVPDLMFCAGVPEGGKDTCQGDSGGPIVIEGTGDSPTVLAGVVSFGTGCARKEYNGVYSRVSTVVDWIDEMICKLSDVPPAGCAEKPIKTLDSGPGKVTLTITYDGYARETALMFVQDSTGEQLYFQPYRAPNAVNRKTETWTFTDLGAGTYTLLFGDQGGDGFW